MNDLFKLLIPLSLVAMSGCVVAPYGLPPWLVRPAGRGGGTGARGGSPAVLIVPADGHGAAATSAARIMRSPWPSYRFRIVNLIIYCQGA